MSRLALIDRGDPESGDEPSLLTRISNRVLGDPQKAPRRLVMLLVFSLFGFIAFGVWMVLNAEIDTSGSSAPIMGPMLTVLTSVWIIPLLALWFTRGWVLFRRRRLAQLAADVTGWSVETVKHLRTEMQTTDGCTRIIASTGETQAEIADRINSALEGETDDDTVDFWDSDDGSDHADDFDVGHDDYANDTTDGVEAEDLDSTTESVHEAVQDGYYEAIALSDEIHDVLSDPEFEASSEESADADRDERVVPWRVRFMEEVKHLWLDLQSGFRTGDAAVKFGVPAVVAFVLQLFAVGLWTTLPVYALITATSTVVGLAWYWALKHRRQRRLRRYRTASSSDLWLDCAGQFKTVETADVTAYMGFIAGRRYASYDREEFVRKTSRTMHQHVSDECVAPSDLQHYARCLEQMKPNLDGHRKNIIQPQVLRELKQTVESAEDELIPKAELAWSVIEQPTTSRIQRHLGYDPEIVAEQYRFLVENAHVLDERDVSFMDANGEEQTITLVFPADKNRLPDVSERHSQFSDRFTDKKGEPVYQLPDVDPRDDLQGFVPTPREAALFEGATPAEVARGGA